MGPSDGLIAWAQINQFNEIIKIDPILLISLIKLSRKLQIATTRMQIYRAAH